MILDLFNTYINLSKAKFEKFDDDNFVDKLVRKFSAIMMVIFASVLGIFQLVGKPIQCWCHNEYSGPRCNYATTYCYITSFYIPVGNSTELPKRDDLESHRILYYQWVPFIFLLQAFLFYFPSLIWRAFYSRSEFDIRNYIQILKKDDSDLKKSPAIDFITHHIQTCLDFKDNYVARGRVKKIVGKRLHIFNCGFYLCFSYLFIKIIYLAVVYFQLFLLNYWLRDEHYKGNFLFGWHNWRLTERFPRMTLCKFQVYILQDQQTHWVQCALPINIYIEKMYIIIWAWLCILLVVIVVDMFSLMRLILTPARYIVPLIKNFNDENELHLNQFKNVLKADGALLLNLVKVNTTKYFVSNIVTQLYNDFKKNH